MGTSIHEVTTAAMVEEKKKLRKSFRLFDMIFFTVAAILGIDTLGVISTNGAQALTWLLISAVAFVFPYALIAAELGSTFTQEGGVYEWCKMAGGRFYASLASTLYWVSNPLWVGGTLSVTAIAAIKTFWFGNPAIVWGNNPWIDAGCEMLVALIFVWGTTWCAIMSLRFGTKLTLIGSYIKFALFAIFVILALVYFFTGHSSGAHYKLSDMLPTANLGLIFSAILPSLIFNWTGFEVQNGAAEEMHHPQRDVPLAILRAGLTALVCYAVPILVITFTVSKDQLSNATGFLASFQLVANVLPQPMATILGALVALGAVVALASSGGSWIIGADRTYAIAALDRNGPAVLGRFSERYGTPVVVNTLSGIVGTIAVCGAIAVNTIFSSNSNLGSLFGLVLGFTISTTVISYVFIFPAYIILKYKYAHIKRVYEVPFGKIGAWIAAILTTFFVVLASYFTLIPTNDTISKYQGVSRLTYELTQFVPLIIIFLIALGFYIWGHAEKRNTDIELEINLAGSDITPAESTAATAVEPGD